MPDYSSYKVPREVPVGREVRVGERRATNRAAMYAIGGVLVLCVCLALGICGAGSVLGFGPFAGSNTQTALNLPFLSAPTTPTPADTGTPTPVPQGKSARNQAGLRLTVTGYQRPLPAQDLQIPEGQELVLVTVRLDNTRTTGGPIKYAPEDFALVSEDGDHFAPATSGITTGENLTRGEVAPGKSAKGDLVFFVYSDIPDLLLAWTSADGSTRLFALTRR